MDDGTGTGFERMAKSRVIYLQNCLYYLYGVQVARDGVWGPETQAATTMIRTELGIGGFSGKENWLEFLNVNTKRGFDAFVATLNVS